LRNIFIPINKWSNHILFIRLKAKSWYEENFLFVKEINIFLNPFNPGIHSSIELSAIGSPQCPSGQKHYGGRNDRLKFRTQRSEMHFAFVIGGIRLQQPQLTLLKLKIYGVGKLRQNFGRESIAPEAF
jgi:hypothetical protein